MVNIIMLSADILKYTIAPYLHCSNAACIGLLDKCHYTTPHGVVIYTTDNTYNPSPPPITVVYRNGIIQNLLEVMRILNSDDIPMIIHLRRTSFCGVGQMYFNVDKDDCYESVLYDDIVESFASSPDTKHFNDTQQVTIIHTTSYETKLSSGSLVSTIHERNNLTDYFDAISTQFDQQMASIYRLHAGFINCPRKVELICEPDVFRVNVSICR